MEKAFEPYRRYFDFEGRSTRTEYWAFTILMTVVYTLLAFLMIAGSAGSEQPGGLTFLAMGLMFAFGIGSFVPCLSVTVRRFHDQDRSGWMTLLGLIPYAGSIVLIVFMCLRGTDGANRWGEDPR